MDRMTEQTAADLARGYAQSRAYRMGDDEVLPYVDIIKCDNCGHELPKEEAVMIDADTLPLFLCVPCHEMPEPECECVQTDVDLYDAQLCQLHNDRSEWNAKQRRIQIERREVA